MDFLWMEVSKDTVLQTDLSISAHATHQGHRAINKGCVYLIMKVKVFVLPCFQKA